MTRTKFALSTLIATGVLVCTGSAVAQVDAAGARLLFDEARTLAKAGDYAAACPKFEQSYQRERGIGTLFNLADCWEKIGRTASAWAKFRDVADEAARTNQKAREQVAVERANALVSQLSKLTVRVEGAAPGLEIRRDGVVLHSSELGRPVPLDPGEHILDATAPHKESWKTTVTIPPKAQTVEVVVPVLGVANPARSPVKNSPSAAVVSSAGSKVDHANSGSSQNTFAYAAAGVGLAGVVVGSIYGLRVLSKVERSEAICPTGNGCSAAELTDYQSVKSEAKSARTVSYIGFGVGGVALATAVTLLLTAPSSPPSAAWNVVPVLGDRQVGGVLQGEF